MGPKNNNNNSRRSSNNPNDSDRANKQQQQQQQGSPSPWPPNSKAKDAEKGKESRTQAANGTPLPSPPQSPKKDKKEVLPLRSSSQTSAAANEAKAKALARLDTTSAAAAANATGTSSTAAATVGPSGGSSSERDPATTAAVTGLIGAMKDTVGALGETFDALGSQTARIAELGPAIDAVYQVQAVRAEVEQRQRAQELRMQEEGERLQEQLKTHIREHLRPMTNQIVADIVRREVSDRVRKQLVERIPASLGDEIRERKLQVLQAKARLHNSEARRHNALIRASSLDEPLQALHRPLQMPAAPQANGTHLPTPPETAPSTMSAASLKAQVGAPARGDSSRMSVNTDIRPPRPAASPRSAVASATPRSARSTPLVPPTPSPHFPPNLSTLVSLGPDEVKALVREYGLVSERDEGEDEDDVPLAARTAGSGARARPVSHMTNFSDAGQSWVEAGLDGTREDDLNKFMRYIGVGFQVLPSSPIITLGDGSSASFSTGIPTSPGAGGLMRSPLVEWPEYAFVR